MLKVSETHSYRSPLASKLLRTVLSVYLLVALFITCLQLVFEYDEERRRLESELDQIAEAFLPVLAPDLWNLDETQIDSTMQGIWVNPAIWRIGLTDELGDSLSELSRNEQLGTVGGWSLNWYQRKYDIMLPIDNSQPRQVGYLTLVTNAYVVLQRAASTFVLTLVNAFIKTLVLWLIFYYALVKIVARPLSSLTQAIEHINPRSVSAAQSHRQDLTALHTDDELGKLAVSFSEFEDALIEKNTMIKDRQSHLESTVVELERASKTKSVFLAHMSHELRTPLNGVLGMVEILSSTELNEQQKTYLSTLDSSGKQLLAVINNILDYSKIESGKLELESIDFSLKQLIDDCLLVFQPRAAAAGITLDSNIQLADIDYVSGDSVKITQVLNNLIGNAIKFTEQGSVCINLICRQAAEEIIAEIQIVDTGIGLTNEEQQRVFQSFSQGDRSTTRKFGGTGLGLAISKQLVELMGGALSVTSQHGVGSSFTFDLHLQEPNLAMYSQEPTTQVDHQSAASQDYSHVKVLVAEDNKVNQMVIRGLLKKLGIDPTITNNGAEAVEQCGASVEPFDIVFMDIEMPVMDGWEATKTLRTSATNLRRGAELKIIGLSAHALDVDRDMAKQRGMDAYLAKPVRLHDLQGVLSAIASPS